MKNGPFVKESYLEIPTAVCAVTVSRASSEVQIDVHCAWFPSLGEMEEQLRKVVLCFPVRESLGFWVSVISFLMLAWEENA